MSAIIDAGENLMLDRRVSVAQTKTQGGRRLAQKRGPTLYNLEVDVPPQRLNGDTYYDIESEVMTLEYGAETLQSAGITGKIGGNFTSARNGWTAAAVNGASQTGTSLVVKSITGTPTAFDYIQIPGSTKVYQLAETPTVTAGSATLVLNTPIVVSPADGATVTIGDDVSFNFALMEIPATNYQPGKIVHYGTFKFEEVIKNVDRSV